MRNALRVVGSIAVGLLVAAALFIAVELFSSVVHPPPPGFQGTPEEIHELVGRYPQWVLAVVVPMWGLTAFLSTWLAGRWGRGIAATMVALMVVAAVVCNLTMLPYPLWFQIVQAAVVLIAVAVGISLSNRRRVAHSDVAT